MAELVNGCRNRIPSLAFGFGTRGTMVCDVGGEKEHGAGGNALFGHGVKHSIPCLWRQ